MEKKRTQTTRGLVLRDIRETDTETVTGTYTKVASRPTRQLTEADSVTLRDRQTTQSGDIRRHGQAATLGDSDNP